LLLRWAVRYCPLPCLLDGFMQSWPHSSRPWVYTSPALGMGSPTTPTRRMSSHRVVLDLLQSDVMYEIPIAVRVRW
jgi:hypothetical protein